MLKLVIKEDLNRLVNLGVVLFEGVTVKDSSPEFWRYTETVFTELQTKHATKLPSQIEELQDVRAFYRATGLDPTKQRPSCEALLRRIISGKGLYPVNNAVDTLNLWSVNLMAPACVHDADALNGDLEVRTGKPGERYLGIHGKKDVNLEGLLLLCDASGPFGNPSADSDRTKVTEQTTRVLMVLYFPFGRQQLWIDTALTATATDFQRWCGGSKSMVAVT